MNTDDALGTSAAQIAVAAGHPQALSKVAAMLDAILKANRNDPISRSARDRFYELAFALAAVGPDARPYVGPVVQIMGRTVQPRRMCRVLEVIGGAQADQARASKTCHPEVDVYEQ
jgi:hypothetical protein